MRNFIRTRIHYNSFEVGIIALLLTVVSVRSFSGVSGSFIAVTHAATLLLFYTMIRAALSRLSETLARAFFSSIILLLTAEGLIQFLTSLHVNWFVISLLLEDNSTQNIGISFGLLNTIALISLAALIGLRIKLGMRGAQEIALTHILAAGTACIVLGQTVYSLAYYNGAAEIMQVRRNLPFFLAPHPYHAQRIFGRILGPHEENPFAVAQVKRLGVAAENTLSAVPDGTKKNILFIITDSLRATEIKAYPGIAPTLAAAAKDGFYSLDHYSVSNCTHFSFYSMFTGRVATTFGEARQNGATRGLITDLVTAGYHASTAESIALDWYDIAQIILPETTHRWIAPDDLTDAIARDMAATQETLAQLATWPDSETPRVHITYYEGSHYPYSKTITDHGGSTLDQYHATIRQFDGELAKILRAIDENRLRENTLVIVTSDHGEELITEGRIGHATALNDNQTVVPFLVLGANDTAQKIRAHTDIPRFVLNQLAAAIYPFEQAETLYLANCDYDHPKDFTVITATGRHRFDFDDGYLVPLDTPPDAQLKAAQALIKTIQNGGIPAEE